MKVKILLSQGKRINARSNLWNEAEVQNSNTVRQTQEKAREQESGNALDGKEQMTQIYQIQFQIEGYS